MKIYIRIYFTVVFNVTRDNQMKFTKRLHFDVTINKLKCTRNSASCRAFFIFFECMKLEEFFFSSNATCCMTGPSEYIWL